MKPTTTYRTILSAIIMATLLASPALASTISQDFEGSSLGSTTPPSGWSYIDVTARAENAYEASTGHLGSGLGGQVTGNDSSGTKPGAYIVNSGALAYDLTQSISGSFKYYIATDTRARSGIFVFGDIQTGISGSDAGTYLGVTMMTDSFGNRGGIIDGAGTQSPDYSGNQTGLKWYTLTFTWTPTSGTTGDFTVSGSNDEGSESWTATTNGFTFNTNTAFFGFGASGYWDFNNPTTVIFDNISITGTIVPESPMVPPEVSSITNNVSGGPVETYNPITYTVTFNEAMDGTTITTNSFTNSAASAATVTFDSVSGSSAEYDVVVTPTSAGDIVLQVSSNVTDLSGNLMTNNVDDTTTITVQANTPTVTNITSTEDGNTPDIGYPITYTVAFSETMDAATVTTGDFVNSAGSPATIAIDSVSPATDTDVFTVVVTPSTAGDLVLQVSSNVTDLAGNLMTNNVDDATTISVVVAPPEVSSITSDKDGETSVDINLPITYTVTFNEVIDASTVAVGDFVNADGSGATITVNSVSPGTDTNVFTVVVTPTAAGNGNLTLRLSSGGVSDLTATATAQNWDDLNIISVVVTPPTVTSISSDKDAGAERDLPITYTVTFSETIDATTVSTNDFVNASNATVTVDSVNPGTDTNVFTVVLTPTTAGDIVLRVSSNSVADLSGNGTDQDWDDDTIIAVFADTTPPEVSSFTDDAAGNPVLAGTLVTYTVTFNEPIDGSTLEVGDFVNASNALITVTSVSPATDTNVFTVGVIPDSGTSGGLKLQLSSNAVVDLSGNTNDVAWTDDTVITVISDDPTDGTWNVDADGNWGDMLKWQDNLIADGTNYTATLGNVITADRTITLDSARTIGNITAADTTHDYTISGANTLTLDRTDATPPTISMPNNRTLRIDSPIAGSDGLAKSGVGTLRITDTSSNLSGDIEIASGTLQSTWQALGSGRIFFTGDATLSKDYNSDKNFPATMGITINPGVRATIKLDSFYFDAFFAGVLAGDTTSKLTVSLANNTELRFINTANTFEGELTISGAGINLSGKAADFYSLADSTQKITVANGLFRLRNGGVSMNFANRPFEMNNNIAGLDNDSTDPNVTLRFSQDLIATISDTDRTLTLAGVNTGDNTFAGTIGDSANGSGAVSVTKEEAGTWILSGTNTYSGTTTINAGTLQIGNGGASGTLGSGAVVNNAALVFNRTGTNTVSGDISGTGALTHEGSGTTLLNGANTYNGNTTVNAGALGGAGSIASATLVKTGAALSPGNPTGALTFSNGLQLETGTTLAMGLGTSSDLLRISGGTFTAPATGTGNIQINITNAGGLTTGDYTLIDWTSASLVNVELADFAVTVVGADMNAVVSIDGTTLVATISATGGSVFRFR